MTDRHGLDRYAMIARWMPGTLLAIPISITLLLGVPVIAAGAGKIVAIVAAAGAPIVISQLVRNAGRRAQTHLYAVWGGAPTTLALRERLAQQDAVAERLRRQLRAVIGDYPTVPDADDAAMTGDDVFDAITNVLRNKTRDQSTFPIVFDELVHYGFWRNCFALRRLGAAIGIVAAACAGVMAGLTAAGAVSGHEANWIIAGVVDIAAASSWLMLRAPRVRLAGERYTEALLSAVENIPPASAAV